MSPLQKRVILILAIANLLLLFLGIPSAFMLSNGLPAAPTPSPVALVRTTPTDSAPLATASPFPSPTRARPTPVFPEGWKIHSAPALGLAIALPPTWEPQELRSDTLAGTIQTLKQKNPSMADALEEQGQQLVAAGVGFFAADLGPGASRNQVITNITIVRQAQKQDFGFDFYFKANVQQLNDMEGAVKPIASRRLQTEVGEMGELHYRMAVTGANRQPLAAAVTQYMFLLGKDSYLVTFTAPIPLEDKYSPIFEEIAKSLRWTAS